MTMSVGDNTGQETTPTVLLRALKKTSTAESSTSRGGSGQGLADAPASSSALYGPDQQFATFRAGKKMDLPKKSPNCNT